MLDPTTLPAAVTLALASCAVLFMTGLLTGLWKYRAMITSAEGVAPAYVEICHSAALMYAFACLILAAFAAASPWSASVNFLAVAFPVAFFMAAVAGYALHGALKDTDNQLRRPHVLGKRQVPGMTITAFIYLLAASEIGGFAVLFVGFIARFAA